MSEYTEVEQPFLQQLQSLGWEAIDQGPDIPSEPAKILRQPNRTLLEANEAIQKLLFKAQVDVNEVTGEQDPMVKLIDFANPECNHFLAINQFRIETLGCVKQFIIS